MPAARLTVSQLADACKLAIVVHQEKLEILKKTALSHQAACDQRYGTLIKAITTAMKKLTTVLTALQPQIQAATHGDTKRTPPTRPGTASRSQGRA